MGQCGYSTLSPLKEVLLYSTEVDWESSMNTEDNQLNKNACSDNRTGGKRSIEDRVVGYSF